jgi:A/G-specific adenine glycosylase
MPPKSTPDIPAFRRRLIHWFRRNGRDLPWRRTRDPYQVLVSEFMLQQTQVARVELFYGPFLAEYPTIEHLARATPARVRESWEGLGYYRRAANLHRLARAVVAEHAGTVPAEPERLMLLPGVGRYTAGAVASFAYERAVPTVDTNIARVIRRAFHPRRRRNPNDKVIWATAGKLVPSRGASAWAFNQGIMELGAVVCTARVARCEICPVASICKTGTAKRGERREESGKAPHKRRSTARTGSS